MSWVAGNGGITSWGAYPYAGVQQQCHAAAPAANISGPQGVGADPGSVMNAVYSVAPASIAICVTQSLQLYSGGVFSGPCDGQLNHAVASRGTGLVVDELND